MLNSELDFLGTPSDVKLKVEIDGYNWNRCNNKYARRLIPTQLCAGGEEGKDSCGGLLQKKNSDKF